MKAEDIAKLSVWSLAEMAECYTPDGLTSAGASFLASVRDAFLENPSDVHQICVDAPSVMTHEKWCEFVDLGAYREDVSELVDDATDLGAIADVALYHIARRLVHALAESLEPDMRYVAYISVPGYMPIDDDPPVFDEAAAAWSYLADERKREEDDVSGDGYSETVAELELQAARGESATAGTVYGPTPGRDVDDSHDLGLAYSVDAVEVSDGD